jgi:hypothetical protein
LETFPDQLTAVVLIDFERSQKVKDKVCDLIE